MGDLIKELPVDDLPPTNDEKDMIRWMYNDFQETREKPLAIKETFRNDIVLHPTDSPVVPPPNPKFQFEIKTFLMIIVLYIVISNRLTDSFMQTILAIKSDIILLCIKSLAMAIILFIYFNYSYKRTLSD